MGKTETTPDAAWIKASAKEIVRYVSTQAFGSSDLVNQNRGKDVVIPKIENILLDAWSKGRENAKR
jgi:hypothetical protein